MGAKIIKKSESDGGVAYFLVSPKGLCHLPLKRAIASTHTLRTA